MNLGTVRVDADLHLLDAQFANAPGFRLADHNAIGLDLDVEQQPARMFHDFEEVAAHEHFAAAKSEEEDSSIRELVQNTCDLGSRHLAVIVVIQIAVDAALVATIGDVEVHADGDAQPQRLLVHLRQKAHAASGGEAAEFVMGCSDTRRIPCCESSLTNCSTSCPAWSGSTSNSGQILLATISDNEVRPSAACHITVATSLRVKKVESTADMIIISPPMRRAAMAELLAMYFSAIGFSPTIPFERRRPRQHYHLPHALVGNKYQSAHRYPFYKLARGLEN